MRQDPRHGRAARIPRPILTAVLGAALVLGSAGCGGEGGDGLLARAAGYDLPVGEVVGLVAGAPQLPNEVPVVEALGELWVDYTLLAEAARRDSTMGGVDLEPLIRQQVERRLILTLRDSVIEADTAVAEPELRELFEEERPDISVAARHILLMVPDDATTLQRDSVRRQSMRIREEAASGETSFQALAREHSQDPGSAPQGGELGLLERGQVLPAIEDAVFALEPGEVSSVVETPYGFHVFRVDERHERGFDEILPSFRAEVQRRRYLQAESTYIAALLDDAALRPAPEAADLTRRMAENPGSRLSDRAARRTVVAYEGGELTLGEVLEFMQTNRPEYRSQVVQSPDSVVEDEVLLGVVQRELLLREARERGLSVPAEVSDSLERVARERFVEVAAELGVLRVLAADGRPSREAVRDRVLSLLREMLSGNREIRALGAVAWTLRKQFPHQVFESGVQRTVQRVQEARGPSGAGPGGASPSGPAPFPPPGAGPGPAGGDAGGIPPDTSGGG